LPSPLLELEDLLPLLLELVDLPSPLFELDLLLPPLAVVEDLVLPLLFELEDLPSPLLELEALPPFAVEDLVPPLLAVEDLLLEADFLPSPLSFALAAERDLGADFLLSLLSLELDLELLFDSEEEDFLLSVLPLALSLVVEGDFRPSLPAFALDRELEDVFLSLPSAPAELVFDFAGAFFSVAIILGVRMNEHKLLPRPA
jgi:hypothetical protein